MRRWVGWVFDWPPIFALADQISPHSCAERDPFHATELPGAKLVSVRDAIMDG